PLLAQHFVVGDVAGDVGDEGVAARGARGDFGITAAGAAAARRGVGLGVLVHDSYLRGCARRGAQSPLWPRPARPNWSICGMRFSACATGGGGLRRRRHRQLDVAGGIAAVKYPLRRLAVVAGPGEEDVVDVALWIAVVERKPARLDLHH